MTPLEQYYRNNYRGQLKLMTRILRGDIASAEDVVQEAYCRALRFWPMYDPDRGEIQPWFNRILFNALRDVQHQYNKAVSTIVDGLDPAEVIATVKDKTNLSSQIAAVENEEHRHILELFFTYGYNSREISQMLERFSQSNVTTVISRFRHKELGQSQTST